MSETVLEPKAGLLDSGEIPTVEVWGEVQQVPCIHTSSVLRVDAFSPTVPKSNEVSLGT